ncbi:MAG: ABC transporter ATP-binding protein [Deltaproteobacteria bacterium]|nr:ABC transporter ATP-binding protein [Deltaproteobacteria bacterium]
MSVSELPIGAAAPRRPAGALAEEIGWPEERVGEAMVALARHCGLATASADVPRPPLAAMRTDPAALPRWLDGVAGLLGIEVEPFDVRHAEAEAAVRTAGPALVEVTASASPDTAPSTRFVALLGQRRGAPTVLTPELDVRRVDETLLRDLVCEPRERPVRDAVDAFLGRAGIAPRRRARARRAMVAERLSGVPVARGWILRHEPGASMLRQGLAVGLGKRLGAMTLAFAVNLLLGIVGWWVVGRGALDDRLDTGFIWAWLLLSASAIPFHLLSTWASGRIAIDGGVLLKQRLLAGAVRLDPEEIRHLGSGQLLGTVIEAEAVESLVLSSGFLGLAALIELVAAGFVLAAGAGGLVHVLLLAASAAAATWFAVRYFRHRRVWTDARLSMTHALVERMLGHRTRIAQEASDRWHEAEDQELERYALRSRAMDRAHVRLASFASRGWIVVALLGLAPAVIAARPSATSLAIALGGVLLARQALAHLMSSAQGLMSLAIAWERVSLLFRAATRTERPAAGALALRASSGALEGNLVEAHGVVFRHGDRPEPTLRDVSVAISRGDRVLLEGPSGGGKSTLASLLAGWRRPQSGLVLLGGLDRQTIGLDAWRARVSSAPQFHENHVLASTFTFNLLMGKRWPPTHEDIAEAEELCKELGLEALLTRMPAGLGQTVGETGWQLSHGEKSRLYLARALLSGCDLVLLDESFAALDPETMKQCLECALRRAPALVVIAHP